MSLQLSDGDQVCVIGGGPSGSFSALHLLNLARQRGLRLNVLIFEPRNFSLPGPGGCNRCAGILSTRLLRGLRSMGLELPPDVIQASIHAYAAHLDGNVLRIDQPDSQRQIVAVYRGAGPRLLQGEPLASFDDYLLSQAQSLGAQHIPARVRKVTWQGRPVVHTARQHFEASLLVLATGVNSRAPLDSSFGYEPPDTAVMAQDEIPRPVEWPADQVSAFFKHPPGLIFGALIPKGRYLNVSLLGKGLKTDAIGDFFNAQGVELNMNIVPESLCGCTPRVAVSPARGCYGPRWVAVGDAAVTRLYKDGIGSAFFTTRTAMTTALDRGISKRAFRTGYAPYIRQVANDNRYGRMLFRQWSIVMANPRLLRAWMEAVKVETQLPPEQRIHIRILWGMFTGDEPYRHLFWLTMSLTALRRLWRGYRAHKIGAMYT